MIREILFRGKDIETGEWVEGGIFTSESKTKTEFARAFIVCGMVDFKGIMFEVSPKSVCQFTGIVDKDGLKIFENDVVRFENYCCVEKVTNIATGIVEFSDAEFCVEQISGIDRGWMNSFYGPDGKEFLWNELEIIGNIFDRDSS